MLPKCIEFHLMQYLLGLKIKHLKALEDNCLSKQLKWRESNFEKYDNFVFWWFFLKRGQNITLCGNLIKEKRMPKNSSTSIFMILPDGCTNGVKGKNLTATFIPDIPSHFQRFS